MTSLTSNNKRYLVLRIGIGNEIYKLKADFDLKNKDKPEEEVFDCHEHMDHKL